jgi:peptidoglycan/LPS O-acetylase OafA/YrhL
MSYVYGKYFKEGTSARAYKKYIGARFARVYPLHFFTLLWAFIGALVIRSLATSLDTVYQDQFNVTSAPVACLFLLQAMHLYMLPPMNTPSWSLSTEWWVYMIFPLFVPFFTRLNTRGKLVTLLLIIGIYLSIRYILAPRSGDLLFTGYTLNVTSSFGFVRCLAGFLLGMLLFSFYEVKGGYQFLKNDWCFLLFFLGVIVSMHFGAMDLLIVAFFPFIILTAAYNSDAVKKVLDTRPLQRLGDWSFSIYMVHMPLIMLDWIYLVYKEPNLISDVNIWFNHKWNYTTGLILCVAVVALTLVVASLTYKYIEVPARNYLNKLFERRHKQVAAEGVMV